MAQNGNDFPAKEIAGGLDVTAEHHAEDQNRHQIENHDGLINAGEDCRFRKKHD